MAQDYTGQDFDTLVADQDPQSAVGAQGFKQIGSAIGNEAMRQYQEGGEKIHQALGPIGAPETRNALMDLGQSAAMSTVGDSPKPKELPDGMTIFKDNTTQASERYHVKNYRGERTGAMGHTPEDAIAEYHVLAERESNPKSKLDKITSVHPNSKLSPSAQETIDKIKEKGLTFFDPEEMHQSFIAKDQHGEPIGHLGIDDDFRTQSIKVDPNNQGQGVASSLYEKALNKTGLLRSSHINNQLEGGRGLWDKFAEENPHNVWQARDPETLEPKDYKVWQKETNPKLRAKEMEIEQQIDELREFPKNSQAAIDASLRNKPSEPDVARINRSITAIQNQLKTPWAIDENGDKLLSVVDHQPFKRHVPDSILQGKLEQYQARLPQAELEAKSYPAELAKWQKAHEKILNNHDADKDSINDLIKQHKALNQKSGHTMFAAGGQVEGQDFDSLNSAPASDMPNSTPNPMLNAPQAMSAPQANTYDGHDFDSLQSDEDTYGTMGQMAKTAVEGFGQGIAGPLAPMAERAMGVDPQAIRMRAEINPVTHYGSEIAGLVLPAIVSGGESAAAKAGLEQVAAQFTQAGLLAKVGAGAEKAIAPFLGETVAAKIGTAAAKGAIENALLAGSDETSRMILQDPNQSAETALQTIGLSAVLGAGLGGTLKGGEELYKATVGPKLGQIAADLKGRIQDHLENPDPVSSVTGELNALLKEMDTIGSETYGSNGIKAEAIKKLVPDMGPKMVDQTGELIGKLEDGIAKLKGKNDPYANILEDKLERFKQSAMVNEPHQLFDAIQNLKKELQAESRYTEGFTPLAERTYRSTVKDLAHDMRVALEDKEVWGKASDIQARINDSFSQYIKSNKDFLKILTTKVGDDRVVDPGKIATFIKQMGNPNAEIKATKLKNFIDSSEQMKATVNNVYDKLGIDSPIQHTPLNSTLGAMQEKTIGGRIADAFIDKMLSGGNVGGAIGSLLGGAVGHGGWGYIIGSHALGPFFNSVLPGIAKALVSKPASAAGARSAIDYAAMVAQGVNVLDKGAKNVFKVGSQVVAKLPSDRDRDQLNKRIRLMQNNPMQFAENTTDLSKYLPEHNAAFTQVSANAATYLNSIRGDMGKANPLDSTPVLNPVQKAQFKNALDIAQNPMLVMQKIKDGALTSDDMKHLSAMYPSLYRSMQQKLSGAMMDAVTKGQTIPYKTRISLSMFLAQPLDSTMTPAAFLITQAASAPKSPQQPQGSPGKGRGSSPALQKMPGLYQTPGNARSLRQNKI